MVTKEDDGKEKDKNEKVKKLTIKVKEKKINVINFINIMKTVLFFCNMYQAIESNNCFDMSEE